VLFREKTKLAASGDVSRPAIFSVLRAAWGAISSRNLMHIHEDHASRFSQAPSGARSLARDFGKQDCPAELHGLIDVLRTVRQRILTNTFLRGLTKWWTWILASLIVIAALSAKLAGAMILAVILAVVGAVVILAWICRTRLSIYDTARRLDSAASLHDRVSTAIFLGDVNNPGEMVQHQRRDAVARVGKVEPRGLFPVRMPATAGHALLLLLAAAGLFAYRLHHKPPLVALLQTTARSQLVQSILSPIVRTLEKDLQRTIALSSSRPEPLADEVRPGDPVQSGDDKGNNVEQEQDAVAVPQPSDQEQPQGDPEALPGDESGQQDGQQPAQDMNGNESASNSENPQGAENNRQSMKQSLMQALKNLMPSPPGQQSNNRPNQQSQPSNAQGMPQSGDSNQPGNTPSDRKGDSRGSSDSKQKPSENSGNGAGNQEGIKELRTGLESHPVKAVPDRIALAPSDFKDPTRVRNATETGTAKLAIGNALPQGTAVINGAEQENIPARYRLYVQRYFEHPDNHPDNKEQ
jgi:hypothetical protein